MKPEEKYRMVLLVVFWAIAASIGALNMLGVIQ